MNADSILLIAEADAPRLDAYLASQTELSRSQMQKLIKEGLVTKNRIVAKSNTEVKTGDAIRYVLPETQEIRIVPQEIPLSLVYEDDDLLVVNKPKGLVVHPAPGNPDGTLVNGLLYHFTKLSGRGGSDRPGIVHRIDKDTSGLLVVAKNDIVHEKLSKQFADHSAHRSYVCLVHGNLKGDGGTVDAPIGRHPVDRKRMAVVENGRHAVTHWTVLERFSVATLLKVELETGRTHQIRVHMAYCKHPIMGDPVYGNAAPKLKLYTQALHGYKLSFTHPKTDERLSFFAPLPEDFLHALAALGSKCAFRLE